MYSDVIKSRLEREVVGQPRAVRSVVRGVTRIVSGMTPRERTFCAYMFMGPTGTGKTLLIQTLARVLHGDDSRAIVVEAGQLADHHPSVALGAQMMPLYGASNGHDPMASISPNPLGIVRIENLERGSKEARKALASALETGQVLLPDARRGKLDGCLLFLTSGLCAKEILDEAPTIGFSGSPDEEEDDQERLYDVCFGEAEKQLGVELMSRLDGLVVFHRLAEEHLAAILDRRFERMSEWLLARGRSCRLLPAARELLLQRGGRDLSRGAHKLARDHQRLVEFPVSDLLVSGRVPVGSFVSVDRRAGEDHLHFTVSDPGPEANGCRQGELREIPVS